MMTAMKLPRTFDSASMIKGPGYVATAIGVDSSPSSVRVGSKVMIIGGYPMQRGLVGTVQRINTAKEGWCYVTVGDKMHSCKISDLLLHNQQPSKHFKVDSK